MSTRFPRAAIGLSFVALAFPTLAAGPSSSVPGPVRWTTAAAPAGESRSSANAVPVAAFRSDLDRDGSDDVIVVIRSGRRGAVLWYRTDGPAGLAREVVVGRLDHAPDLVVVGDFDSDGGLDLVAAPLGAYALDVLLANDDGSSFVPGEPIELGGALTALIAADANRPDDLADLIAAVDGVDGPELVVFESPTGAVGASPERIRLPARATALAAGRFSGTAATDLAAACGRRLVLVRGRDRGLHTPGLAVDEPVLRTFVLPEPAEALAAGRWGESSRPALAIAIAGGTLRFADANGPGPEPRVLGELSIPSGVPLRLQTYRSAGTSSDGLLVIDGDQGAVHAYDVGAGAPFRARIAGWFAVTPGSQPVAVPLRIDADGLDDLAVFDGGKPRVATTALTGVSFVVTSTADGSDAAPGDGVCDDGAGRCTLRAAIEEANATAGADTISFALGSGTPTVAPATALPPITDPVAILGDTGGATRIELDGTSAGGAGALVLASGSSGSLVRRLVVNRFASGPAFLVESADDTVEACWIGLDALGGSSVAGNADGVVISGAQATGNLVGGTTPAARNVVSRSAGNGIRIEGGASDNRIEGNLIGTNAGANFPAANGGDGVAILGGGVGNRVGGAGAVLGMPPGNVISGNSGGGVDVGGGGTSGTLVEGNLIGTNGNGQSGIGNAGDGVRVHSGAADNTIGGTTADRRNVISGNNFSTSTGVELNGTGTSGNHVLGNFIGLAADGDMPVSNGEDGIRIAAGAQANVIGAGTATPGAAGGNVISGNNRDGVRLEDAATTGATIQGNVVGLRAAGDAARGNGGDGVAVLGAPGASIGGDDPTQRNVISGNAGMGVSVVGAGGDGTLVRGNYIGTDVTGETGLGNAEHGILLSEPGATGLTGLVIGGPTAAPGTAPGNVISGNGSAGVRIEGFFVQGATVQGNLIGLDAAGEASLGNHIGVDGEQSRQLLIGGAAASERNVISGNTTVGVRVSDSGDGGSIEGNYIGTDATGAAAVPNSVGVNVSNSGVRVGGSTTAPGVPPGNVVSGNSTYGVLVSGPQTAGTEILGNAVGSTPDGLVALPNDSAGIALLSGASGVTVGGSGPGSRNLISGNASTPSTAGVLCSECGNQTYIRGNWIGLDATGLAGLPNGVGVELSQEIGSSQTPRAVVGGTNAGEGNFISGNLGSGIRHFASTGGTIQGNRIGVAADGMGALGNGGDGIEIASTGAPAIGGTTGITPGACTGACNEIRFNGANGIADPYGSPRVLIRGNSISDNAGMAIDLAGAGVTPNDVGDALRPQNFPAIISVSYDSGTDTSSVLGTLQSKPSTTYVIELFGNPGADPSGYGEAGSFAGSTTCSTDISGNGSWTLAVAGTVPNATATATSPTSETSELSAVFVDADADSYADAFDNCPGAFNPDQIDSDFDEHGDTCDCAPGDASAFGVPTESTGLAIAADRETIAWASVSETTGPGTVYDLLRGTLAGLPVDGDASEACTASGQSSSSVVDSTLPASGEGLWYLVRARNACATASYGFASDATERISGTCP